VPDMTARQESPAQSELARGNPFLYDRRPGVARRPAPALATQNWVQKRQNWRFPVFHCWRWPLQRQILWRLVLTESVKAARPGRSR